MTQIPDYIRRLAIELGLRPGTRRETEDEPATAGELPSQQARARMIANDKRPIAGGDHEPKA